MTSVCMMNFDNCFKIVFLFMTTCMLSVVASTTSQLPEPTTTPVREDTTAASNCGPEYVCFEIFGEDQKLHNTFLVMVVCVGGGVILILLVLLVSVSVCLCRKEADADAGSLENPKVVDNGRLENNISYRSGHTFSTADEPMYINNQHPPYDQYPVQYPNFDPGFNPDLSRIDYRYDYRIKRPRVRAPGMPTYQHDSRPQQRQQESGRQPNRLRRDMYS